MKQPPKPNQTFHSPYTKPFYLFLILCLFNDYSLLTCFLHCDSSTVLPVSVLNCLQLYKNWSSREAFHTRGHARYRSSMEAVQRVVMFIKDQIMKLK